MPDPRHSEIELRRLASRVEELERRVELLSDLLRTIGPHAPRPAPTPEPRHDLTPREREILGLVIGGNTNRQIAESLFLSEKTVKQHLGSLYRKLGVENRTQAAMVGIELGIDGVEERWRSA